MTLIGILLFVVLSILGVGSFVLNRDLFSPSKFYLFFLFFYFLDIFFNRQLFQVYGAYAFYLFLGIIIILIESIHLRGFTLVTNQLKKTTKPEIENFPILFLFIFFVSLIPIGAQIYMIYHFGGLENYMISLVLRVQEWEGLHYIIGLKEIFPALNLIYLIILILFQFQNKKLWIFLYVIHLLFGLGLGLLSGSRSSVLNQFISIMIVVSIAYTKIKFRYIFACIFFFFISSELLSEFRLNVGKEDYGDSQVESSTISGMIEKSATFRYGINPIEHVYKKEFKNFYYGLTYASAITNFIPRKIWPGKPDPSGVILTKFYLGYSYDGLSNESSGLVTEAIINFGYFFAYPFGFAFFIFCTLLIIGAYRSFYNSIVRFLNEKNESTYKVTISYLILVVYFSQILGALTFGDFTNIFFGLIKNLMLTFPILWIAFGLIRMKNVSSEL